MGQGTPWDRGLGPGAGLHHRSIANAFLVYASARDGCRGDLRYCFLGKRLHKKVFSSRSGLAPLTQSASVRMLQLQLSSWLLGVLVLAVGILLPLGLAASRNKVLQQAWEKATGKTV